MIFAIAASPICIYCLVRHTSMTSIEAQCANLGVQGNSVQQGTGAPIIVDPFPFPESSLIQSFNAFGLSPRAMQGVQPLFVKVRPRAVKKTYCKRELPIILNLQRDDCKMDSSRLRLLPKQHVFSTPLYSNESFHHEKFRFHSDLTHFSRNDDDSLKGAKRAGILDDQIKNEAVQGTRLDSDRTDKESENRTMLKGSIIKVQYGMQNEKVTSKFPSICTRSEFHGLLDHTITSSNLLQVRQHEEPRRRITSTRLRVKRTPRQRKKFRIRTNDPNRIRARDYRSSLSTVYESKLEDWSVHRIRLSL